MKSKILILFAVVLFAVVIGCNPNPDPDPTPTPKPTLPVDYLDIPDWLDTPVEINHWYRQLGAKWTSDEVTTGYADYRFTPVEFGLDKIPDVNKPGRIIEKTPYQADCDDFSVFSGYVAYVKLHCNSHIVHILCSTNVQLAHAVCYGIIDGKYHFWDNDYYRGAFDSVQDFVDTKYPGWIVYYHRALKEHLEELFLEGHLEYAPTEPARKSRASKKSDCKDGTCPIN